MKIDAKKEAMVLVVNGRFVAGYNGKRMSTSFTLAGAKLFLHPGVSDESEKYEKLLKLRGKKFERKIIGFI